jgi:hypothetical protein
MRICKQCQLKKDESEFYPNYSRKKGYYGKCKKCMIKNKLKKYNINKEKCISYAAEYARKNPEKRKVIMKRYTSSPKGIYLNIRKRSNNVCSKEEFLLWYSNQKKICHYCGIEEKSIISKGIMSKTSRLTVDQLLPNKGYRIGNIVLACPMCNLVKGNYFTEKEMLIIGKIIKRKQKYD